MNKIITSVLLVAAGIAIEVGTKIGAKAWEKGKEVYNDAKAKMEEAAKKAEEATEAAPEQPAENGGEQQ